MYWQIHPLLRVFGHVNTIVFLPFSRVTPAHFTERGPEPHLRAGASESDQR
jgi:hypothetical protein